HISPTLPPPIPPLFPYTTLFRSGETENKGFEVTLNTINIQKGRFSWDTRVAFSLNRNKILKLTGNDLDGNGVEDDDIASGWFIRSEEHTSELQSRENLVCRLLLE